MTNDCCRNMTQAVVNWMLTGFVTFVWVGELGNESALCFLLTWVPNRLHRNWLVLKLHTRTMTQPPGQLSSGPRSPLTLETPQLRGGPGRLRATWLGDSSPGWVPTNPQKSLKRLNFIVLIYSTDLKMKTIRILNLDLESENLIELFFPWIINSKGSGQLSDLMHCFNICVAKTPQWKDMKFRLTKPRLKTHIWRSLAMW